MALSPKGPGRRPEADCFGGPPAGGWQSSAREVERRQGGSSGCGCGSNKRGSLNLGQGDSTDGRGEPRPRAAGIVGGLPRVRGRTPGLPPRGGAEPRSETSSRFGTAGHRHPGVESDAQPAGSATTGRLHPTCASWCAVVRPGTTSPRTRCFASRRIAISDLGR